MLIGDYNISIKLDQNRFTGTFTHKKHATNRLRVNDVFTVNLQMVNKVDFPLIPV